MLNLRLQALLVAALVMAPAISAEASQERQRGAAPQELADKQTPRPAVPVTPTPFATVNYSGTIAAAPTFNRPLTCATLSGTGTAVGFDARTVTVDITGSYTIEVTSFASADPDSFLVLYSPSFSPAAPLTNCIAVDDDGGTDFLSRITANLTAGTQYVVVTTTFGNGLTGNYTSTITGPGTATVGGGAAQANIGVTMTAPSGVPVSGPYTYVVTASNAGPDAATGVVATIDVGAAATITSTSCVTTGAGGSRTWTIGGLANGASSACTINVNAVGPACSAVAASASITASTLDPVTSNNSASATNQQTTAIPEGGFEGGTPSPAWAEASSNFGSPICDVGSCGTGNGTAAPRSGAFFAWFGGFTTGVETGSVQQSIAIPAGTAAIEFHSRLGACAAANGASDFVRLTIDGNELWRRNATDPSCGATTYSRNLVDVSALAGPTPRVIRFESTTIGNGAASNLQIDDVSFLQAPVCSGPPPAPGLSLVKRVQSSSNPANCATAGSSLSVVAGSQVYYCYQATNTGNLALQTHNLTDTAFGTSILTNLQFTLAPGASSPWILSPALTVTQQTSSAAIWSACAQDTNCVGAPPERSATATVAAGVVTAAGLQPVDTLGAGAKYLFMLILLGIGLAAVRRLR
jgi:hypothetical protein